MLLFPLAFSAMLSLAFSKFVRAQMASKSASSPWQ